MDNKIAEPYIDLYNADTWGEWVYHTLIEDAEIKYTIINIDDASEHMIYLTYKNVSTKDKKMRTVFGLNRYDLKRIFNGSDLLNIISFEISNCPFFDKFLSDIPSENLLNGSHDKEILHRYIKECLINSPSYRPDDLVFNNIARNDFFRELENSKKSIKIEDNQNQSRIISILGTDYTIIETNLNESPNDGYTDWTTKTIKVHDFKNDDIELGDKNLYRKHILKHEIIHAFLIESGLGDQWEHKPMGHEETVVDWFAYMYPKIKEVFDLLGL